ncbi:unnamed protein product [Symbiodinium sp. CCMP2592]|nr:unnamed protein product [Symbiodinium sp. CCMP2592]
MVIKDILDEWVRGKDEGKKHSRAGEARRKEEIRQQGDLEGHELLEPFQFISDAAVEVAFEAIAPLLASFGCSQPPLGKYKDGFEWILKEHDIMGKNVKKKESQDMAAAPIEAEDQDMAETPAEAGDQDMAEAPTEAGDQDMAEAPAEPGDQDMAEAPAEAVEKSYPPGAIQLSTDADSQIVEEQEEEHFQYQTEHEVPATQPDPPSAEKPKPEKDNSGIDPKDSEDSHGDRTSDKDFMAEKVLEEAGGEDDAALSELQSKLRAAAKAKATVEHAEKKTRGRGRGGGGRGGGRGRSGAALKRPAAAKRKVDEVDEVGPETEVVEASAGMAQSKEEDIDAEAKPEKKAKKGEQEADGNDDKGKNDKKNKKDRTAEEKEVLDSIPELENYRVLQLAIVMPYWSRPFECGVVRKATSARPKKQVLFISGKHTGLPITWKELVDPCIKAAESLEEGKEMAVVEDAFEQDKMALAKLTAQRLALGALAATRIADVSPQSISTSVVGPDELDCGVDISPAESAGKADMKRGNGSNCTAAGADVSKFIAQAKARAALAKGVTPTPKVAPAPASVSAKSTAIKSPDMKKPRTGAEAAAPTKRLSTKGWTAAETGSQVPSASPMSTTMTPLGPKVLAKEFATPGSMSVDTPTEKKCDEWWGDESWHSAWDAHGWDSWYRRTPSSWDGWGWGSGSWSAGDWQASSVQWGRRGAVEEIKAEEESQPDLETLLERAYESYGESDSGSEKEKGSRSLRSGAALKRPAAAKRKVDEVDEVGPETEVVEASAGMAQSKEEDIDAEAKPEKKAKKGEQEADGNDDKGKNDKKNKKDRTAEEKEVLDSIPELENYRVLQLAIVMPYWSRPFECGVVRKATSARPKKQVLFISGKHTGLPITWKELVDPCIKAAESLEEGKEMAVVEDAFEQDKMALAKLTAQRRAEKAVK